MQKFYIIQSACSAECQQLSEEEDSHIKESLHSSTLMADPSEPHESTAIVVEIYVIYCTFRGTADKCRAGASIF